MEENGRKMNGKLTTEESVMEENGRKMKGKLTTEESAMEENGRKMKGKLTTEESAMEQIGRKMKGKLTIEESAMEENGRKMKGKLTTEESAMKESGRKMKGKLTKEESAMEENGRKMKGKLTTGESAMEENERKMKGKLTIEESAMEENERKMKGKLTIEESAMEENGRKLKGKLITEESPMEENGRRMKGTLIVFSHIAGLGFIKPDDGSESLFVHDFFIRFDGLRSLVVGKSVEYVAKYSSDGTPIAVDVSVPRDQGSRHVDSDSTRQLLLSRMELLREAREAETLFPGLSDDVGQLILARTSKEDLVSLCTVCKRWLLFLRPRLGFIDIQLLPYLRREVLHVRIQADAWCGWHQISLSEPPKLLENPNCGTSPGLTNPPDNLQLDGSAFAALKGKIYMIGGTSNLEKTVWVLDCSSNTMDSGPQMRVG
ncbi:hypothetical protein AgCh_026406 [Apium graveolens]